MAREAHREAAAGEVHVFALFGDEGAGADVDRIGAPVLAVAVVWRIAATRLGAVPSHSFAQF